MLRRVWCCSGFQGWGEEAGSGSGLDWTTGVEEREGNAWLDVDGEMGQNDGDYIGQVGKQKQ